MKQLIGAVAATKAVEMAAKTETVARIIDHATDSAERVADLLDEITGDLEEEQDDLSVQ